ncbi:NAD-specific glutamate dehydrogenase [Gymnopus androsaceus JB14]|uniref:NAD-specific glutamate dehydrogenase n=1 Tax=Gymnopus androsaceus JB14 TaxID=1447944 RepID=A0A6A4GN14_9AGAR|nr:NAD-specific glutamate dehydrogenase [Gymnopus androsaceus JB14]
MARGSVARTADCDVLFNRVKNLPVPVFTGKEEQRALVQQEVAAKNWSPTKSTGFTQISALTTLIAVICDHIIALFGAKVLAFPSKLGIDLEKIDENGNGATFIYTSPPGITTTEGPGATCESRIDTLFLDNSKPHNAYRLETFRSAGSISATASQQLRCYFVSKCVFPDAPAAKDAEGRTNINSVSDKGFLEKASENTLEITKRSCGALSNGTDPSWRFSKSKARERDVLLSDTRWAGLQPSLVLSPTSTTFTLSARKYVEQFSNGVTIVSLYPNPVPNSNAPPIEHSIFQVMKEASLLFCLPENPFFLPKAPAQNVLDKNDPAHSEVLNNIKRRFREETFTRESIEQVIHTHSELIRLLYVNFAMVHYPASDQATELMPTLSYQRLQTIQPLSDEELYDKIRRTVPNKHSLQVLESFLIFNKHILKTNFYQPTKVTLSFRLDPGFLPDVEYPKKPFAMFFVIGNEFRGFHIRDRDVARGGIRIVMSRNKEMYSINQRMLFDENYNLASTQSLKNKDIPEGGAKGTILPSIGATPRLCFEKYVDAIVDLLIPGKTPGIKETLVDLYEKPELLFFGPDEDTADMMDWAALHTHDRGAETWWKSFTTGKCAETLGGVPHDTYGMTSLSIRQYVLGIYKQLGLKEREITKVQTGGPDGDLGSNEILLSSDKTIAIIDGSGVLADPTGLDREELVRLAKKRLTVAHFDRTKLSKDGYLVKVEEQDVKLPSGEIVLDGSDFRNGAHLRPEAVNISHMAALFDSEGKSHFKYIVEGANLFLTQQARLFLEKRKVVVFKDSSTNKGGVTSSSLEVLAGLALSTEEYVDLMIFKDGKPSEFYQSYVKDIQEKITENAAAEFHCLWKEHTRLQGAKPRTTISDELSSTLNNLQAELESSDLFEDVPSRNGVMRRAIPKTLVEKIGLETLLKRLPEAYQRALFSSWVASHFLYNTALTLRV